MKKKLHFKSESLHSTSMKLRIFALISMIAASAILSGCASDDKLQVANQKTTFFGLITYDQACFTPTEVQAMNLRTQDAFGRDLPSGDRLSFGWGLISIEDY